MQQQVAEKQKLQPAQRKSEPSFLGHMPEHPFLVAQNVIGNHGMLRLSDGTLLQRKLEVGAPTDECELEADRVADEVMRMPEPEARSSSIVHRSPLTAHHSAPSGGTEVPPEVEAQIQAIRSSGGGRPLSDSERAFFEPRFGRDFSGVRIHDDSRAVAAAGAVTARAFAVGQEVVFGREQSGQCNEWGRRVLGHELTHVVLNGRDRQPLAIRCQGDKFEPSSNQGAVGIPSWQRELEFEAPSCQLDGRLLGQLGDEYSGVCVKAHTLAAWRTLLKQADDLLVAAALNAFMAKATGHPLYERTGDEAARAKQKATLDALGKPTPEECGYLMIALLSTPGINLREIGTSSTPTTGLLLPRFVGEFYEGAVEWLVANPNELATARKLGGVQELAMEARDVLRVLQEEPRGLFEPSIGGYGYWKTLGEERPLSYPSLDTCSVLVGSALSLAVGAIASAISDAEQISDAAEFRKAYEGRKRVVEEHARVLHLLLVAYGEILADDLQARKTVLKLVTVTLPIPAALPLVARWFVSLTLGGLTDSLTTQSEDDQALRKKLTDAVLLDTKRCERRVEESRLTEDVKNRVLLACGLGSKFANGVCGVDGG